MKVTVEITVKVDLEIEKDKFIEENSDSFENAIPDENEDYRDAAIESEAVALFVQECDYSFTSTVNGITVKSTELRSYDN